MCAPGERPRGARLVVAHKLFLSQEAGRILADADAPLARKLEKCFARIASNPRGENNVKALKGPLAGYLRFRVGNHRVIYSINDVTRTVSVVTIAHRSSAYD